MLDPDNEDAFRMERVADVGGERVETCLIEASVSDTIGVDLIGSKGVLHVWLRKKVIPSNASGNVTGAFVLVANGTKSRVLMNMPNDAYNVSVTE